MPNYAYKRLFLFYLLPVLVPIILSVNSSCNSGADADPELADSLTVAILPEPEPVSTGDSLRIYNASRLWFDTVLKPRKFSGGMIVAKNGRIIFEAYNGTAHIAGTDTINFNTSMHIASITKTFTAMAVLKLMQDGKLNLDDEFSKIFPEFNYPGVTVRTLLNHRSGLPNYNYFMEDLGWDKSKYVSNADILNYLITRKPDLIGVLQPNTHFSYCNTNYALLALLIEKISGLKYEGYLQKTFFTPLKMKNTYVFNISDTAKATPSYNWRGNLESFNFLDQVYGDKNIYTTPKDLLIWDRALSSNIFLTEATLEQAYSPYSNEKPGVRNYGLGWRMNLFPDGNKIIYHNGWWHGSNATFIRLLKQKATIIVIGNKFTRSIYHAKVLTSLFGNYYSPIDEGELEIIKNSVVSADSLVQIDSISKSVKKTIPAKKSKD